MNEVSFESAKRELFSPAKEPDPSGLGRLKPLAHIQHWLGHYLDDKTFCFNRPTALRFAPSLISRSDAQLFGISMPRFALRLYVDAAKKSFVNLRRAKLLSASLPKSLVLDSAGNTKRDRYDLIGDSYFEVPLRFRDRFKVLTSTLSAAYGESDGASEGTAFVRYTDLSGACAQACCYIASVVLKSDAKGIYGLPEISALASEVNADSFTIGTLSPDDMVRYFRHQKVGLEATYQALSVHGARPIPKTIRTDAPTTSQVTAYQNLIRSYVLSGMPVIVMVDYRRLNGHVPSTCVVEAGKPLLKVQRDQKSNEGINDTGFIPPLDRGPMDYQPMNHCMVVVGCTQDPGSVEFLVHDPLTCPYLQCTADMLVRASCYRKDAEGNWNMRGISAPTVIPVTPNKIKLPLQTHRPPNQDSHCDGLIGIAKSLQFIERFPATRDLVAPNAAELNGYFRLTQVNALLDVVQDRSWGIHHRNALAVSVEAECAYVRQHYGPDRWVWVQKFSNSLWLWDAEQPARKLGGSVNASDWLMCVIGESTKGRNEIVSWHKQRPAQLVTSVTDETENELLVPLPAEAPKPQVSLITSFDTAGYRSSLSNWPEGVECGDLYTFMQRDVEDLLIPLAGWSSRPATVVTAREVMARLSSNRDALYSIGEKVSDDFQDREIKLVSMATFLPELLDADEKKRSEAVEALAFAIKLAGRINSSSCGFHKISAIEIVAGSSTEKVTVQPCPAEQKIYKVEKLTSQDAIARFVSALSPLASLLDENGVSIALEIEPGPLFAFNDAPSIVDLVAVLDHYSNTQEYGQIANFIGINLDVGHWSCLCGMDPAFLLDPAIMRRIAHAHISDHDKGHFGDAVVQSINSSPDHFLPWLRALCLRQASMDESALPIGFSKAVSVELECCRDVEGVMESISRTKRLLTKC